MLANFLQIASELRNRIYELLLLHQEPLDPWNKYNRHQKLSSALLRVNKTIHYEASPLFYGQNCFDLSMRTPENILSFLRQIGRSNAHYIRNVYIDFPDILYLDPGDVALGTDSVSILADIQSRCANVRVLTTSLSSTNAMELRLDALDHPKVVIEALQLANTRFKAIFSLQKIIVEVYEDSSSDQIRREFERHGWTIKTIKPTEEEDFDRSFSDFEPDDYSDDNECWEDDYDIDNDSDFWRRAAD